VMMIFECIVFLSNLFEDLNRIWFEHFQKVSMNFEIGTWNCFIVEVVIVLIHQMSTKRLMVTLTQSHSFVRQQISSFGG
jgi:hypothetical protein